MNDRADGPDDTPEARDRAGRPVRADARRNLGALIQAASAVFATSGVDAPVREIAEKAGVGLGTMYRHFPKRSDLVVAVFRSEVDACADAAREIAAEHAPGDALELWMQRYMDLIVAKRGLAAALYSGDPAFDSLPAYFEERLKPALQSLLEAAAAAGEVCADTSTDELLHAVGGLCTSAQDGATDRARRMIALLVDGLRYRARGGSHTETQRH